MCIIIDANCGSDFNPISKDAIPVYEWLTRGGRMASGGKLKVELLKCGFRKLYAQLRLAGRIVEYAEQRLSEEVDNIEKGAKLKSNDIHIIALARVSGARLLFSRDGALHKDFRNPKIIAAPRGKVYQRNKPAHTRLLARAPECRMR